MSKKVQRTTTSSRCRRFFKENLLTMMTIIGVLGGGLFGFLLKEGSTEWTEREVMYIQYPGDLFLR